MVKNNKSVKSLKGGDLKSLLKKGAEKAMKSSENARILMKRTMEKEKLMNENSEKVISTKPNQLNTSHLTGMQPTSMIVQNNAKPQPVELMLNILVYTFYNLLGAFMYYPTYLVNFGSTTLEEFLGSGESCKLLIGDEIACKQQIKCFFKKCNLMDDPLRFKLIKEQDLENQQRQNGGKINKKIYKKTIKNKYKSKKNKTKKNDEFKNKLIKLGIKNKKFINKLTKKYRKEMINREKIKKYLIGGGNLYNLTFCANKFKTKYDKSTPFSNQFDSVIEKIGFFGKINNHKTGGSNNSNKHGDKSNTQKEVNQLPPSLLPLLLSSQQKSLKTSPESSQESSQESSPKSSPELLQPLLSSPNPNNNTEEDNTDYNDDNIIMQKIFVSQLDEETMYKLLLIIKMIDLLKLNIYNNENEKKLVNELSKKDKCNNKSNYYTRVEPAYPFNQQLLNFNNKFNIDYFKNNLALNISEKQNKNKNKHKKNNKMPEMSGMTRMPVTPGNDSSYDKLKNDIKCIRAHVTSMKRKILI